MGGVGWCSGVRPSHTHFFVAVVVFFFCEIDNSKQTDNTDIFQSSSLHKFSDSAVRIWFSLLYPGARVGWGGAVFKLRSLSVSPSALEWFKSYLKERYQYVRFKVFKGCGFAVSLS